MGAAIGLVVLNLFAALWAWAGLRSAGVAPTLSLLPVGISLAILAAGWRRTAIVAARGAGVGRLIGLWTGIEFAALFVVANVLVKLHHVDLMLPLGAIIVGLHFIPLARGIPVRAYMGTAAGLLAVGLVGMLLPGTIRSVVVGLGAATVLWGTALAISRPRALASPI